MNLGKLIDNLKILLGGTDNALILSSILSFLVALLLVIVTLIYVILINKQNIYLKARDKDKYLLNVRQESIKLLMEIGGDEIVLKDLLEIMDKDLDILSHEGYKKFSKNYIENNTEYILINSIGYLFDDKNYKSLLSSGIKYRNPELIFKITKIYEYMFMIKFNLPSIYKPIENKDMINDLKKYIKIVKGVLKEIDDLYNIFKQEKIYDFKNSKLYEEIIKE